MRGLVCGGTNLLKIYVVRKATEGLPRLIESKGGNEYDRGVAIAYDSHHFSPGFAFESAADLAKQGIKSYVYESLHPTPELSFVVASSQLCRHLSWSQPASTLLHFTVTRFTVKTVDKCLHTMLML